jgi:hypothetical protein
MGQDSWEKMTSPVSKLTALTCHLTKKVNIAEELIYLSTSIGFPLQLVVPGANVIHFLGLNYPSKLTWYLSLLPCVKVIKL